MKNIILLLIVVLVSGCVSHSYERQPDARDRRIESLEAFLWETRKDVFIKVVGYVHEPGLIALKDLGYDGGYTLHKAIVRSGGFKPRAAKRKVLVIRDSKRDGEAVRFEVDMTDTNAQAIDKNFILEPGDVVFIPEQLL